VAGPTLELPRLAEWLGEKPKSLLGARPPQKDRLQPRLELMVLPRRWHPYLNPVVSFQSALPDHETDDFQKFPPLLKFVVPALELEANCQSSSDWQFKQSVAMAVPAVIPKLG
jgi:hypothetical protein